MQTSFDRTKSKRDGFTIVAFDGAAAGFLVSLEPRAEISDLGRAQHVDWKMIAAGVIVAHFG